MMTVLIPRGQTVPCHKEDTFSTYSDNQPAVTIRVFEGERARTDDKENNLLGTFELPCPPMPRGVPRIKVRFDVDANCILNVTASEESTGKSKKITIADGKGRRTKEEIERLVQEASKYASQDKQVRDTAEARNSFESYIYNVKNTLDDNKSSDSLKQKMGEDKYKLLKDTVVKYVQWLEQNSATATKEDFEAKQKEATGEIAPVFAEMYKKDDSGPDMSTFDPKAPEQPKQSSSGPKVEECD